MKLLLVCVLAIFLASCAVFEAKIERLSSEGRGIAKINGKTTFLFGGLVGETVKFSYTLTKGQYDEGNVVEVIEANEKRVAPKCAAFGVCGGCCMQHLEHTEQLTHKLGVLQNHFELI